VATVAASRPRVESVPTSAVSSAGAEAVELARMAGLELDPWQELVLEHALGERGDGSWAAARVGVNVPRQNGKGALLEARELAGLFLLGEELLIHSAHQFDTSLEAFHRLLARIEATPEFSRLVKRVSRTHGDEGITLTDGRRVRFRTRTGGGGRGFSCDCLIVDEAMYIPDKAHAALLPTLSARRNPQVWYTGSAVDQLIHADGLVWARVREAGVAGTDDRLAYFEWSVDGGGTGPGDMDPDVLADWEAVEAANPAFGVRITREWVATERAGMDDRSFAVERLGVGDWPATSRDAGSVIPLGVWRGLVDHGSRIDGPVVFAFDVSPDRSSAAVCAAGRRADGLVHVEVVERGAGTGWVAPRLGELVRRHDAEAVLCDKASAAWSLEPECREHGVSVVPVVAGEYAAACGVFFDLVDQAGLRHLGTGELDTAVRGAAKRPLVDAWAWSRKSSGVDITPLVGVTLAAWRVSSMTPGAFLLI